VLAESCLPDLSARYGPLSLAIHAGLLRCLDKQRLHCGGVGVGTHMASLASMR